jgi:curved DNA-binding protein CbpA
MGSHYDALQVLSDAHSEVVRAAYRALALLYHPDRGTGSAARMTELNEAWETLRDPASRREYDHRLRLAAALSAKEQAVAEAARAEVRRAEARSDTLDFGRYAGWSIAEVARRDPNYLEWFVRTPAGKRFAPEAARQLAVQRGPAKGRQAAYPR